MNTGKAVLQNLLEKLRKDKKLLAIVGIGVLGMLVLLFSELFTAAPKESKTQEETQPASEYTYAQDVEQRLQELLACVQGVGKVEVMVTLENGLEQVYAENEHRKASSAGGVGSAGNDTLDEEHEYIVIRSAAGDENGLIIKVVQPAIRGVAIVCEGGDSALVKQQIVQTVTAVLNISSARVSVVGMQ